MTNFLISYLFLFNKYGASLFYINIIGRLRLFLDIAYVSPITIFDLLISNIVFNEESLSDFLIKKKRLSPIVS